MQTKISALMEIDTNLYTQTHTNTDTEGERERWNERCSETEKQE